MKRKWWIYVLGLFVAVLASAVALRSRLLVILATHEFHALGWQVQNLKVTQFTTQTLSIADLSATQLDSGAEKLLSIRDAILEYRAQRPSFRAAEVTLRTRNLSSAPPSPAQSSSLRLAQLQQILDSSFMGPVAIDKLKIKTPTMSFEGSVREEFESEMLRLTASGNFNAAPLTIGTVKAANASISTVEPLTLVYDRKQTAMASLTGRMVLNASTFTFGEHPLQLAPVNGTLRLSPSHTSLLLALETAQADTTIHFTDLRAMLELIPGEELNDIAVHLDDISGRVFDGNIRSKDIPLKPRPASTLTSVQLENVDLEQIAALYKQERLTLTGRVDGTLPIRMTESGFAVENGSLEARAPGGVIRYEETAGTETPQVPSNESIKLVSQALRNFHYSSLHSSVEYDAQGNLKLQIQSFGSNPDLFDGHPITLNINLEDNIPALLKSIRVSGGGIAEIIRQGVESTSIGH